MAVARRDRSRAAGVPAKPRECPGPGVCGTCPGWRRLRFRSQPGPGSRYQVTPIRHRSSGSVRMSGAEPEIHAARAAARAGISIRLSPVGRADQRIWPPRLIPQPTAATHARSHGPRQPVVMSTAPGRCRTAPQSRRPHGPEVAAEGSCRARSARQRGPAHAATSRTGSARPTVMSYMPDGGGSGQGRLGRHGRATVPPVHASVRWQSRHTSLAGGAAPRFASMLSLAGRLASPAWRRHGTFAFLVGTAVLMQAWRRRRRQESAEAVCGRQRIATVLIVS